MSTFDVIGGLAVVFGLLNLLFPRFGFRSSWPASKESAVTGAGTELTRLTGCALVVVGAILLLV